MTRRDRIDSLIRSALNPIHLVVEDQSARHAGHAGAKPEGETHFHVTAVSPRFAGMNRVDRHRAVYQLLSSERAGGLHALTLDPASPDEWQRRQAG